MHLEMELRLPRLTVFVLAIRADLFEMLLEGVMHWLVGSRLVYKICDSPTLTFLNHFSFLSFMGCVSDAIDVYLRRADTDTNPRIVQVRELL